MPTRLNYTGRRKITLDHIDVHILPIENGPATFDLGLHLEDLRPRHDSAHVFIEAYRQSTRMRFDWGTVGILTPPPTTALCLTEFTDWRRVLFRIKVTDVTEQPGKLIAWCDQIKPAGPDNEPKSDLLWFENADLDGPLWALRFDDVQGPVVQIANDAGDCHTVGGDPRFQAAVFPEIMRRVLTQAFITDRENGHDEEHWSHAWLDGFLKPQFKLPEPPALDDEDGRREWIEQAVQTFAHRHRFGETWATTSKEQP